MVRWASAGDDKIRRSGVLLEDFYVRPAPVSAVMAASLLLRCGICFLLLLFAAVLCTAVDCDVIRNGYYYCYGVIAYGRCRNGVVLGQTHKKQ